METTGPHTLNDRFRVGIGRSLPIESEPAKRSALWGAAASRALASIYPPVNPQHLVVGGLTPTTYWGITGGMWWSKKGRIAAKVTPDTLEERQVLLEAEFRSLKAEWLDVYDRLYRLAGRIDSGKRWSGEKPPSPPTAEIPKVPENGSEPVLESPAEIPAVPAAKMTRTELLRSLTR